MKRLSAILALIFIACTGWAAVDYPVTIPFTNSAAFTNVGPRAILARVTISVVTPQAATATVSIVSAGVTNQILSHASTSFRVAHWPPSSASTNTFLESNDIVRVTCSAAGQAYAVIDAVAVGSTEVPATLLIVDGNNTTSQPTVLKFSGSAQTDLGGGRWLIIQNSSTSLLEKAEADLTYATTQDMAAANANIDQEVLDREADVLDLQQFTSALLNTQIQHKAIMDGFSTNLDIAAARSISNAIEAQAILAIAKIGTNLSGDVTGVPGSTVIADGAVGTNKITSELMTMIKNAGAWNTQQVFQGSAWATPYPGNNNYTASTNLLSALFGQEQNLGFGNYWNYGALDLWSLTTGQAPIFWRLMITTQGYIRANSSSTPQGVMWDSANDGSTSGLDADMVDGIDSSNLIQRSGTQTMSGALVVGPTQAFNIVSNTEITPSNGVRTRVVQPDGLESGSEGNDLLLAGSDAFPSGANNPGDVMIRGGIAGSSVGNIIISGRTVRIYGATNVNAQTLGGYLPTDFPLLTTLTTGGYLRITSGAVTSNSMPGTRGEYRRNTTNAYFHDGSQWVTWSVYTNFTH